MDLALHWVLRLGLALVFGVSALAKLRNLGEFRLALRAYGLLPLVLEGVTAFLVPALELVAVGLLLGPKVVWGASLLIVLLFIFSGAILIGLQRGGQFDCGCLGGWVKEPLTPGLLLRNTALALLAGFLLFPPLVRPLELFDLATILFGGLLLFLMYLGASVLLANLVRIKNPGPGGRA